MKLDLDQGVPRSLPATNADNRYFWTGGEHQKLLIFRCEECQYYVHPPVKFCPKCEGRNVKPSATSGKGVVCTFTVNHKAWLPSLKVPYIVALISIAEQEDVRLVCNIVHCEVDQVYIGMPVKVLFEKNEDLWIPLFEPDADL